MVWQPRDLAPSSSCPTDQDDALGARSSTILGRVPWRLGDWWRLAEREHSRGAGLGSGWAAGGAGLASWGVGTDLGRLEPAAELERFGRKCRIAWDDFCAAVKRSTNPSTAGPNRPVGETGESRKGILSASFISVSVNHKWRSNTTRLAMDLPIAWAVVLVTKLHQVAGWRQGTVRLQLLQALKWLESGGEVSREGLDPLQRLVNGEKAPSFVDQRRAMSSLKENKSEDPMLKRLLI